MYGIFTYIWLIFMLNVGKYYIHGWYGVHEATMCFLAEKNTFFPEHICEISSNWMKQKSTKV